MQSGRFVTAGVFVLYASASADTTPQEVGSLQQSWTTTGLVTADDNWSGVPGIIGYRGDGLTASAGVDPQTIVADGSAVVDVTANQTVPADGVTELQIANPTIALRPSDAASAPHLVLTVDSQVVPQVRVRYLVRDLDGSANNAVQQVALQYRIGVTGNYTNVPDAFVADATTANSATQTTAVNVLLPADAAQHSVVQIRIITANAAGIDEAVGIDDIRITLGSLPPFGQGATTPTILGRNMPATFLATIDPGVGPASTGLSVYCNMSALGTGVGQTTLFDSGLNGDATAGDNVFTRVLTVGPATSYGTFNVPCTVEDAESRTTTFSVPVTVAPQCGDGAIESQELCDDGNVNAGDGCTASCNPEMGWSCSGQPTVCVDVDECASSANDCDVNATCTNTPGSFSCACSSGYTGDGRTCFPSAPVDNDQDGLLNESDNCLDVANPSQSDADGDGVGDACDTGGGGGGGGCASSDANGSWLLVVLAAMIARRRYGATRTRPVRGGI